MKKVIFIFLFFLIIKGSVAQPYHKMLDSTSWCCLGQNFNIFWYYWNSPQGDSLLNSFVYKKYGNDLLREDTIQRRVYIKRTNSAEVLLYDFNLNVNDPFVLNAAGCQFNSTIILKDTVLTMAGYRKRFVAHCSSPSMNFQFIESLGSLIDPFMLFNCVSDPIFNVICVHQHQTQIYQHINYPCVPFPNNNVCSLNTYSNPLNCFNDGSGMASAVMGGNGNFSYQWYTNPTQNTQIATGLSAGCYTVVVTDQTNNCSQAGIVCVSQPSPISINAQGQNVSCYNYADGFITTNIIGGTQPYNVQCSPAGPTGLSAGIYTVTVTDANGCTALQSITITQPSLLSSTISYVNASCGSCPDGSATCNPSGGTPPYTFSWISNSATTQTVTGLIAGVYTCCVTDANGCSDCQQVVISALTGIISIDEASSFMFYPNPAHSIFTISSNSKKELRYTILNSLGQKEVCGTFNKEISIDVSHLSHGIYMTMLYDLNGNLIRSQKTILY